MLGGRGAVDSNCIGAIDGNRQALVKENSFPVTACYLGKAIIKEADKGLLALAITIMIAFS